MNATQNLFTKEVLKHKTMLIAFASIGAIALVSGIYYFVSTRPPAHVALPQNGVTEVSDIHTNGTVEPAVNPDLSFQNSGRVVYVGVSVGATVSRGTTLAYLDTSSLSAALLQAKSSLAAEQAKLDALQAGPRSTDIAVKQSAVDQANQVVTNSYAALPATLSDAYAKAYDSMHTGDTLFTNPNSSNPSIAFTNSNNDAANAAALARSQALAELALWNGEVETLSATASPAVLDSALDEATLHLKVVRDSLSSLVAALNTAIPSTYFSQASISAALTTESAARDSVNSLILSLTNTKQSIASEKLSVNAAQSALNQLNAGASPQDIAAETAAVARAQAGVSAAEAQLSEDIIVAPFPGTVASVSIKTGELATAGAPAIELLPNGAFQVPVYVTEIDVTHIHVGDSATMTLDAYGAGKTFSASVAEVDQGTTEVNGVPAYKVTLIFDAADPAIKSGMTANAIIHPSH